MRDTQSLLSKDRRLISPSESSPRLKFLRIFCRWYGGEQCGQAEEKRSSLLPAQRKIRKILNRGELSTGSIKSAVHNDITGQKIQQAVNTTADGYFQTVINQRGPLLSLRKIKPAASLRPSVEKHANPWRGIRTMDYSSVECPTAKSVLAVNTD